MKYEKTQYTQVQKQLSNESKDLQERLEYIKKAIEKYQYNIQKKDLSAHQASNLKRGVENIFSQEMLKMVIKHTPTTEESFIELYKRYFGEEEDENGECEFTLDQKKEVKIFTECGFTQMVVDEIAHFIQMEQHINKIQSQAISPKQKATQQSQKSIKESAWEITHSQSQSSSRSSNAFDQLFSQQLSSNYNEQVIQRKDKPCISDNKVQVHQEIIVEDDDDDDILLNCFQKEDLMTSQSDNLDALDLEQYISD
ncbi:UNKNOWN [Stylonychia lemnae]|uniref:Uncharacterized protein n=1 Tax=Stylonychia lemnae TaxID=5949 RepID=A0A078A0H4_STYLE|nr:UNKNOWN [Stylonychia lemnae]|eukprot:CDW74283.1 UNKNOWN [Stylonychia lemnae]